VRVSDGSTAELFVGQERSFVLQTGEDESTLETVEAGITLNVTPKIINGEELKLEVAPDISHLTQDGEDEMVVRRSELSTTVYAKNNETLTLAGMTLDEVVNYESQVPVLGDIPLVRWLFQSKRKEKGKRELLIFITPKIIEGQANEAS
jgi:type II secretory pathway component GspD/PulD (secretin)